MGRYRGTFTVAANYEPLKAAPFDARQLVEAKSDLVKTATWAQENGDVWTYVGMMVVVSTDVNPANNGLYILKNKDYTNINNWEKQATEKDIQALQEKIDNIEIQESAFFDITVDTEADLPEIGNALATYYVKENLSIQKWDMETQSYINYGGAEEDPDFDIELIFGGNANGTN